VNKRIEFAVNDEPVTIDVKPHWTLLRVLRDVLGLTGTKEGCGQGECGSCTVLLDGKAVNRAWCWLRMSMAGRSRRSRVGAGGLLHPLQQAFVQAGAIQCGYCTPGMILTAKALLDRTRDPPRKEIRLGIAGNLCRCTGYAKIVEAIQMVVETAEGK